MILPDLNLLLYAYNTGAQEHGPARAWWEAILTGTETVGVPWVVSLGFVRLVTSPSMMAVPAAPAEAIQRVRSWLQVPHVQILEPGPRHLDLLEDLARQAGKAGSLTTDIHLAALAIENNAELHSNDGDFGRFSGLRWKNPLKLR